MGKVRFLRLNLSYRRGEAVNGNVEISVENLCIRSVIS